MGLLYAPDSLKQLRVYPFWRPRGFERARRLSVELLDELKETARPAIAGLAEDERAELDEIVALLTGNLEKIAEHGRRADGIVKSMLEHSRGVSGERRSVDISALVDEALNLAYHGARAQRTRTRTRLVHTQITRIADFERLQHDGTLSRATR